MPACSSVARPPTTRLPGARSQPAPAPSSARQDRPTIERISAKLAAYCVDVQTAAVAVDILAPQKVQKAATEAKIVVATICAAPPSSVASAIQSLAAAYAAIDKARKGA